MIDEKFIEDLRERANSQIVDVIGKYVRLTKAGKDYKACCPFHEEKTPSFTVSESRGTYKCFGGCDGGGDGNKRGSGDALDFVINYNRLSYPEGIKKLAQDMGLEVVYQKTNTEFRHNPNVTTLKSALNAASAIYARELGQSKEAILYLKSRGVIGNDVKDFLIGYAPNTFSTIKKGLANNFKPETLRDASLLTIKAEENKSYDFFNNRIMFPVRNEKGDVIGFGARRFDGIKTSRYINSAATDVFDKSSVLYGFYEAMHTPGIDVERGVFNLVEGYLDVIACHRHGLTNTVAAMGTAFTEQQARKLFNHADKIRFMQDSDKAGIEAIVKSLFTVAPFLNDNKSCSIVILPEGQDPDSILQSNSEGALKNLKSLIKNEMRPSTFLIEYQFNKYSDDPEGKAKALAIINSFIDLLKDENLKLTFKVELHQKLGVEYKPNHTSPEDTFKSLPAEWRALLESLSSKSKTLAGIYSAESKWALLFPVCNEMQDFFSKKEFELIQFSLTKPSGDMGKLIQQYLKSFCPSEVGDQIEFIAKLGNDIKHGPLTATESKVEMNNQ